MLLYELVVQKILLEKKNPAFWRIYTVKAYQTRWLHKQRKFELEKKIENATKTSYIASFASQFTCMTLWVQKMPFELKFHELNSV